MNGTKIVSSYQKAQTTWISLAFSMHCQGTLNTYLSHITVHKNTQRKWLKESIIIPERRMHTEICTWTEICTEHIKDLDYSTVAWLKCKLKQLGLGQLRLHCTFSFSFIHSFIYCKIPSIQSRLQMRLSDIEPVSSSYNTYNRIHNN